MLDLLYANKYEMVQLGPFLFLHFGGSRQLFKRRLLKISDANNFERLLSVLKPACFVDATQGSKPVMRRNFYHVRRFSHLQCKIDKVPNTHLLASSVTVKEVH